MFSQATIHQPVTLSVAMKFALPESAVGFRLGRVPWTAVPEATIHKDGQPRFTEYKVWLSEHRLIAPPADNVVVTQKFHQGEFRVLVPTPANTGHHLRTFSP
jgi:hypothetical protein